MDNLKAVKNHGMGLMLAVENNRLVSTRKGAWTQVQALDIPEGGMPVSLRDFGNVRLFRMWLKDQPRHYVVHLPDDISYASFG